MRIQTAILMAPLLFVSITGLTQAEEAPPVIGGAVARPKPQVPLHAPDVVIEWQNILDDCSTEKICVQGGLYNDGPEPAYSVKLQVEIGSHNLSKPRMVKSFMPEQSQMNPGDRQEFYFELERKMNYKDRKGQTKVLEVGKYNFKVVPIWTNTKTRTTGGKPRATLNTVKKKKKSTYSDDSRRF